MAGIVAWKHNGVRVFGQIIESSLKLEILDLKKNKNDNKNIFNQLTHLKSVISRLYFG